MPHYHACSHAASRAGSKHQGGARRARRAQLNLGIGRPGEPGDRQPADSAQYRRDGRLGDRRPCGHDDRDKR